MGFFVVHILDEDDKVKLLTLRWRLGKDPLLIKLWQPNFNPRTTIRERKTSIWIELPIIPIEYHAPTAIISIGNLIGTTLALDVRNSRLLQAIEPKICIEADICSHLPPKIFLNSHSQEVIYENITFFFPLYLPLVIPFMYSCYTYCSVLEKIGISNLGSVTGNQMVINDKRKNKFVIMQKIIKKTINTSSSLIVSQKPKHINSTFKEVPQKNHYNLNPNLSDAQIFHTNDFPVSQDNSFPTATQLWPVTYINYKPSINYIMAMPDRESSS